MRPKPGAQQGPEALDGVDVDFMEAVAVFIAGVLVIAVADGLVVVAPRRQAAVDVILVGQHEGARRDGRLDQGVYRNLTNVFKHVDDHLAAALQHAENGGLLLFKRATAAGSLQAVSSALAVFFLPPKDVPCALRRHRPRHTPLFHGSFANDHRLDAARRVPGQQRGIHNEPWE